MFVTLRRPERDCPVVLSHAARLPSVAEEDGKGGRETFFFFILCVGGKGVRGMLDVDIGILALARNAVSRGNEDFYGTR